MILDMTKITVTIRRLMLLSAVMLLTAGQLMAANAKRSVPQVTETVTVSENLDYTVTSSTPFGDAGIVNIANTDHAVLILSAVKPSAAIKLLASHVQINGAKAVNNSNCQVKLYNRGCIILPYGNATKPLTVYSEQNFEGESCNDFGLENSGGYMNTLTEAKLNNKIRSFRLKRGYMVTFSTLGSGRGYSRCFIAADNDLEVKELPAVLDQKITSYRVFKWYDTGKQQLAAADGNTDACGKLNVTSTYNWGTTTDMSPDVENVPHHIYENYPSPSALGACTTSPHMKTNNEPMNTADDPKGKTESVEQVLANWEDLMRTGMRLCSPSSWDGSDYTNGTGYIKRFIDSIDARGWRCDIIDLHCYWPESNFGTIKNWTNSTGRPVWISEWVWGASWNSNGAFASGVTEAQNAAALKRICPVLNANDCIERYYYWNGERDPSRLIVNGTLTEAGQYYSTINSGVGYNGKYDFVPTTPPMYAPSKFKKSLVDGKIRLTWYDSNGEYNQLMEVQKKDETGAWVVLATIEQKESAASYTYTIDSSDEDVEYRVHVTDLNGKDYYTNDAVVAGDMVEIDGKNLYVGGNMLLNSDFDLGFTGWTNGKGTALGEPQFQVVPDGGFGGGAYLQAHGSKAQDDEASLLQLFDVEAGRYYLFSAGVKNLPGTYSRVSLTADGKTESKEVLRLSQATTWETQSKAFNTETYTKVMLSMRWLAAKAQVDKVALRPLFDTREAAIADAIAQLRKQAEQQKTYFSAYEMLNNDLTTKLAAVTTTDDAAMSAIETALAKHLKAIGYVAVLDSLNQVNTVIAQQKCAYYDEVMAALKKATDATTAEDMMAAVDETRQLLDTYMDFTNAATQPQNPSFATASGWETKVGSYTGGDQRTNTVGGKTCWNAWWGIAKAENPDATMEIRQTVSNLAEGFYVLECKATTEHFCLSDQHGYIKSGDQTVVTPNLSYDYFDLPVDNIWQTLTTTPVYVAEGGEVTIGFVGSKNGATDGKYHTFGSANATGDNREGWWCATDFVLKYHPVFSLTTTPNQWTALCLPYITRSGQGTTLYQVAGVTSDFQSICVEPIDSTKACEPCLYLSETATPTLYTYGANGGSTGLYGNGGLRGYPVAQTTKVPNNTFYLKDGQWERYVRASGVEQPAYGPYTAYLLRFSSSLSNIAIVEDWNGLTIPINGVSDEDKEALTNAIVAPQVQLGVTDGLYSIDGRSVGTQGRLTKGIYIKVVNGSARKVVVR